MHHRSRATLWLATFCLASSTACHAVPGSEPTDIAQVCAKATRFRDEWLTANPSEETATLQRGEISSVVRSGTVYSREWHVTFTTETGPGRSEGRHTYSLHVYVVCSDPEVKLVRVVRGPDVMS